MLNWVRSRLAAKLALAAVAVALAIDGLGIWGLEEAAVVEMRRLAAVQARTVGRLIQTRLAADLAVAERVPLRLAASVRDGFVGRAAIERALCAAVETSPVVYGSALVFVPGAVGDGAWAPYCHRTDTGLRLIDLGHDGRRYDDQAWYASPLASGQPVWTEPYFDEGGGDVLMVTRAVPVTMRTVSGDRLVGVATADVALGWLDEAVRGLPVSATGYAFLVGPGELVAGHPGSKPGVPSPLAAAAGLDAEYRHAVRRLLAAGSDPEQSIQDVSDPRDGRRGWMASAPLGASGWHAVLFFPEADRAEATIAFRRHLLAASLIGGLLLALAMAALARSIVRPVSALAQATVEVAGGRLDSPLPPIHSQDEVGHLARSFGSMQQALVRHVERERLTAAEQERLEGELRIARSIQLSLIPPPAALAPERLGCDVHGALEPARAVGGDLYDVLRRADGSLCFLIGDVSDKGIPAALLMAVTHTLFRAVGRDALPPERVLSRINEALAAQNAADMFVTLQCGVFEPVSGALRLASGGHTRPIVVAHGFQRRDEPVAGPMGAPSDDSGLLRPQTPVAHPRALPMKLGTVVGVAEGLEFPATELTLQPGEALVLYTDGVTEAHDTASHLFGEERLLACLAERPRLSAREIAEATLEAVHAFSAGREPFDDIAILVLRRPPERSVARLEIAPEVERLREVTAWLAAFGERHQLPATVRQALDLALDELLANVIDHGRPDPSTRVVLSLERLADRVRLELRDRGVAFDPRSASVDASGAADGGGGLGLDLVRRSFDVIDYAREADENRVVLEKKL
ncbi:MAG: SpoIIE family protein phosphatase [Vicinamibacteria bacterium]|nr:SpoIIE family protein phosphatase [Vicinamibacteria bacterium]MCL4821442.1 SpoIIE family protein phosphatase [Vicinamibacteria bacterium]